MTETRKKFITLPPSRRIGETTKPANAGWGEGVIEPADPCSCGGARTTLQVEHESGRVARMSTCEGTCRTFTAVTNLAGVRRGTEA